jgi:CxxC motif-containing protein (DUF1111 family)
MLAGSHSVFAATTKDNAAYSQPLGDLDIPALQQFDAGKSEFAARWVAPFLSGGHWGRGPQSNAGSCLACHAGNGRGKAPDNPGEAPLSLVLRLSMPGADASGRPRPHAIYGTTLNLHGVLGQVVEEGDFRIAYRTHEIALAPGQRVELRAPRVQFDALWYGPVGNDTILSLRLAQPVFGLGLLEAVSESTLTTIARHQRKIGFNGRLNMVLDEASGGRKTGRFGHKASQPDLRQQVASAFHDEIGVTSNIFPHEQCPPIEPACARIERVSGVEARDEQIDRITDYMRLLAAPEQRDADDPVVMYGAEQFTRAKCSVCHVPEMKTGNGAAFEALRNRTIHAYTDLLLHDMGAGLADERSEFQAGARDWRTSPLWGIGLRSAVNGHANLLHDGRARNVTEAILWHGGEAGISREAFLNMSEAERAALIRFVESL